MTVRLAPIIATFLANRALIMSGIATLRYSEGFGALPHSNDS